mgnify:CR=1 FL=1
MATQDTKFEFNNLIHLHKKEIPQMINRIVSTLCLAALAVAITPNASEAQDLNESVEEFGYYVLSHWQKDPRLKDIRPPQIITNVNAETKVLGACSGMSNGQVNDDVGGTSYCTGTNTIYVVQDQLKPLFKHYGPASIGYVLAHEYGHYLQAAFEIPFEKVVSELQADCLAGAILGQGAKELGIKARDVMNMSQAAYTIGDPNHGDGAQRAYAVYAGFGYSKELSCSTDDMKKLFNGSVTDPTYQKLASQRSSNGVDVDKPQTHLKSISNSLLEGL